MENINKPEVVYSAALERAEKHSADLKEVKRRLEKARLEKKEQKEYLKDINSDEAFLAEKDVQANLITKEVLEDRIQELDAEINYLLEKELGLIALIEHETDKDRFMQAKMDHIPPRRA